MPKTHPNPTLLLNLSNPSSTCRAFSQHTSAARILELLEMTEYKFYLHLGEKNQFITETLKPIPSRMCWGNTDCQTSQVKEKQTENTGNKPVCGTAPGHTQGVPGSGTLVSLPLPCGCCPGEQHCPRPSQGRTLVQCRPAHSWHPSNTPCSSRGLGATCLLTVRASPEPQPCPFTSSRQGNTTVPLTQPRTKAWGTCLV